jgi:hypothetical protein
MRWSPRSAWREDRVTAWAADKHREYRRDREIGRTPVEAWTGVRGAGGGRGGKKSTVKSVQPQVRKARRERTEASAAQPHSRQYYRLVCIWYLMSSDWNKYNGS